MKKIVALLMVMVVILAGCVEVADTQKLEFIEGKTAEMYEETLVAVFFDYTNGSGETRIPCEDFDVKAFQHGVEIPVMVYTGEKVDEAVQCDASVQAGTATRVVWMFEPEDDSTVTIEVSDGQKFEFEISAEEG